LGIGGRGGWNLGYYWRIKMAYIEINDCSKIIKKTTILDHIDLKLEKNRIYGFVGRNGSGKTMLFKILTGLAQPSSGEIRINGQRVSPQSGYPVKLGVMIENNGLWPYLTAFENLSALAAIRRELSDEEIAAVIERVGLSNDGKKFAKYSLGMKQRLVFAQAIMEKPELLILDEPTNALDTEGVRLFKEIIRQEKERGATVLIASHSLEDFPDFCDAIIPMEAGRVVEPKGGSRIE
jgi:ABC-2 type transport system ATP-binding protein